MAQFDRIPVKSNPVLFDLAAKKIQEALGGFAWMDHCLGIMERLTDVKEGKKFSSANLYVGRGHYEQIMPCEEIGNFSFIVLRDPQVVGRDPNVVVAPFSLIVWYDTRKVSLPTDERNRELIKAQILGLLTSARFSWLKIGKIYERPENVFADFSYDYTNNQFLMSPYAGLRIDGEMSARVPCYIPPEPSEEKE